MGCSLMPQGARSSSAAERRFGSWPKWHASRRRTTTATPSSRPNQKPRQPAQIRPSPKADRWIEDQSSAIGRRSSNRFDEGDGRWRDRSHMSAVVSPQSLGAVALDACSRGPGWRGSRSARRVALNSKSRNASTYGRAPRIIDDRARPRIASERAFLQGSE